MASKPPAARIGRTRPAEPADPPFIPLHCCRTEARERFVLLSERVFGLETHWHEERPVPCTAPLGTCNFCDLRWNRRWRGFASAVRLVTGQRCIVQLTDWAWRHCPDLQAADGALRGRSVAIWREGGKPQGKLWWALLDLVIAKPKTAAVELDAFLSRLFGLDLVALQGVREFNGDLRPFIRTAPRAERGRRR